MGSAIHRVSRSVLEEQLDSVWLRIQRFELLRRVYDPRRLRHVVAALLCGSGVESVHGWRMVLVSGHGIHVGVGVSLGLDALLLRELDVCARLRLGMATRRREHLAWWKSLCGSGGRGLSSPGCA